MRAIWNDAILAESDDTVLADGNHYFPPGSLDSTRFAPSETRST